MWDSAALDQLEDFPTISELLEDFASGDEISELEPLSRDVGTEEHDTEESWHFPSYLEYEEDMQESCEIKPCELFSPHEVPFNFHRRSKSTSLTKQDYTRLLHRLDILTERVGALTEISEKLRGELKKREPMSHKRNPSNGNQKGKSVSTPHNSLTESMISSASSLNVDSPKKGNILKSRKRPSIPFIPDYCNEEDSKKVLNIRNKVSRGLNRKSRQDLNPLIPAKKARNPFETFDRFHGCGSFQHDAPNNPEISQEEFECKQATSKQVIRKWKGSGRFARACFARITGSLAQSETYEVSPVQCEKVTAAAVISGCAGPDRRIIPRSSTRPWRVV